jgi:hypothetical protein
VLTALGFMATGVSKIHQSVQIRVCHGKHMPPTPAIPTIGPTEFLVFFVAKRHAAIAAITCGNVNIGFVDELHGVSNLQKRRERQTVISHRHLE